MPLDADLHKPKTMSQSMSQSQAVNAAVACQAGINCVPQVPQSGPTTVPKAIASN